jgi:subtilisin family serine protease
MLFGTLCATAVLCPASPAAAQTPALSRGKLALEADPSLEADPHSLLVRFKMTADDTARTEALALVGGTVLTRYTLVPGLVHASIACPLADAVRTLAAHPAVLYAEPDFVVRSQGVTPNDAKFPLQWAMRNTGQTVNSDPGTAGADARMTEGWTVCTGEPDIVIALLDAGTMIAHPDLTANIWKNTAEIAGNGLDDDGNGFVDDIHGWDFYAGDANPSEGGHGTHTAGIIGADGNNGIGVVGVSWECQIMPLRFIGPLGGFASDAVRALEYAAGKSVRISNNSWGGSNASQPLSDAIAALEDLEHVFVAAAGNLGLNTDVHPFYPASYPHDNIVSVAASTNDDTRAWFSNYGPLSVDLAAPGVSILSTYGLDYGYLNGTSMACAHVTGIAAMLVMDFPEMTASDIRQRLIDTARLVPALGNACRSCGVLDAAKALGAHDAPPNAAPSVTITAPAGGALFEEGFAIRFTARAEDEEDGLISDRIIWSSNLQGDFGAGAEVVTAALVAGEHVVTARVADLDGAVSSQSRTVLVKLPAVPNTPVMARVSRTGLAVFVGWHDRSDNETGFEVRRQRLLDGAWREDGLLTIAGANLQQTLDGDAGPGSVRYAVRAMRGTARSAWSRWMGSELP